MEQSATAIPWMILIERLEYVSRYYSPCLFGAENIRLRPSYRNEDNELLHLKRVFAEKIRNDSTRERQKFPHVFGPPKRDEIVLSDDVVRRVGNTVRRSREDIITHDLPSEHRHFIGLDVYRRKLPKSAKVEPCRHLESRNCSCVITHWEQKAEGLTPRRASGMGYGGTVVWPIDLIMTLIVHGEMEPILKTGRGIIGGLSSMSEWVGLYRLALKSYICLNVLRFYSCIGGPASRANVPRANYRSLECYQKMLVSCTQEGIYTHAEKYLHRDFFGISKDRFSYKYLDPFGKSKNGSSGDERPYGLISIELLLELEKPLEEMPSQSDVNVVILTLRRLGLPGELVAEIMEYADYPPRSRLRVPHDPLHPDNKHELESYLTQCWQILVRCDMMARAGACSINWENEFVDMYAWKLFW